MKTRIIAHPVRLRLLGLRIACVIPLLFGTAQASIAYGSINNFDTVNDTGRECHGFEIEIEDCHSTDITYTYNYNHYGTPEITQDDSIAGHPKCVIRWESKKNPDGSWASFTDDSAGNLVRGGAVQVSTPSFNYLPAANGFSAQVQAVIEPPEPPEAPEVPDIFEPLTGILSGTPEASGEFPFRITVDDGRNPALAKNDVLTIAPANAELPPSYVVDTQPQPMEESPDLAPGSWENSTRPDTPHDGLHHVELADPVPRNLFFRLK